MTFRLVMFLTNDIIRRGRALLAALMLARLLTRSTSTTMVTLVTQFIRIGSDSRLVSTLVCRTYVMRVTRFITRVRVVVSLVQWIGLFLVRGVRAVVARTVAADLGLIDSRWEALRTVQMITVVMVVYSFIRVGSFVSIAQVTIRGTRQVTSAMLFMMLLCRRCWLQRRSRLRFGARLCSRLFMF